MAYFDCKRNPRLRCLRRPYRGIRLFCGQSRILRLTAWVCIGMFASGGMWCVVVGGGTPPIGASVNSPGILPREMCRWNGWHAVRCATTTMVAPRRGVRYGGIIVTPGRIPGLLHVAPNGAMPAACRWVRCWRILMRERRPRQGEALHRACIHAVCGCGCWRILMRERRPRQGEALHGACVHVVWVCAVLADFDAREAATPRRGPTRGAWVGNTRYGDEKSVNRGLTLLCVMFCRN
jgi:hypothetical protein